MGHFTMRNYAILVISAGQISLFIRSMYRTRVSPIYYSEIWAWPRFRRISWAGAKYPQQICVCKCYDVYVWMYHVCLFVCVCVCICVCRYVCAAILTHFRSKCKILTTDMRVNVSICLYACMYACIYVCVFVYLYVCMYVCSYGCVFVCMFVCMHVCMHVRIHVCMCIYTYIFMRIYMCALSKYICTGWWRPIGCLKLQVIFRKRATNYRALLREMIYEDKASYVSSPPCTVTACNDTAMHIYVKCI